VLPKYRSAVVLDRSNLRTGFLFEFHQVIPIDHSAFHPIVDLGKRALSVGPGTKG